MKMVSAARKLGAENKIVCFGSEITGTFTNPKNILGSSFGEDFGFRYNNFSMMFNDT
jgi:hypothetical protein